MKIINNRSMAQCFSGTSSSNAGAINDPDTCAGWSIMAFDGKLPTSKAGFDALFSQSSLTSMYNACLGIVRSPVTAIENGNVISLSLQPQYVPKGVSYYGSIGSAGIMVNQLLPNRIVDSVYTRRNITLLACAGAYNAPASRSIPTDIDIEFDNPVTVTHFKQNGVVTTGLTLVAVDDSGVESSLGAITVLAGDSSIYSFATPRASNKYRFKYSSGLSVSTRILLSSVDVAPSVAATSPTWAALAHCNTFTHGDIDYSADIMFASAAVGNSGPFKIVGQVMPALKTTMYCPKLRFTQRSS